MHRVTAVMLTMFGEVYSNNKPILAVLILNPKNKNGIFIGNLKIASAYGKDNAQNLINTSEVLFVSEDKKRIDNWNKRTGLQLPVGLSVINSANIIRTSEEKSQDKNSLRNTLSEASLLNDEITECNAEKATMQSSDCIVAAFLVLWAYLNKFLKKAIIFSKNNLNVSKILVFDFSSGLACFVSQSIKPLPSEKSIALPVPSFVCE